MCRGRHINRTGHYVMVKISRKVVPKEKGLWGEMGKTMSKARRYEPFGTSFSSGTLFARVLLIWK
jgi:hypothetical protein